MKTNLIEIASKHPRIKIKRAIAKIYGLGNGLAFILCRKEGICLNLPVGALESDQLEKLTNLIVLETDFIGQELKKKLVKQREDKLNIKTYKSLRKVQGYPARGQRTHSNAKTARKKRL